MEYVLWDEVILRCGYSGRSWEMQTPSLSQLCDFSTFIFVFHCKMVAVSSGTGFCFRQEEGKR
jgi:hypothetical protein